MEFNNNNKNIYNYNKSMNRFKSVSNIFTNKLSQIERSNSNINSSTSKKTAGFEESLNYLTNISKKMMNSFSNKLDVNNLRFSANTNTNNPVHQSQELSMKDIKEKNDVNGNFTNINISIVNPNFSINNLENSYNNNNNNNNNIANKRLNVNIINNTLVSFKENNNNIKVEENKSISKNDCKNKMISSIYKDYLENKSNEETFSENFKDESKKNMFKEYLKKRKIIQYEYNTKGNIAGFSAYMYPNAEKLSKDKICLNININKLGSNEDGNEKETNHLINFFSLFSGDKKDDNDELTEFLRNNLKDTILNDKDLINNPQNSIKNGLIKCELNFINKFIEEKSNQQKNIDNTNSIKEDIKIPSSSIYILLNIDNLFYIANIGSLVSIISCNYSKQINYILKDDNNKEFYDNLDDKRKSINSLFNYNNINEEINNINNLNNIDENNDINNSQLLFNKSNLNINNNIKIFVNNTTFIRTFPGKALYDYFSYNINNDISNNILNKNNNNKRFSKNKINKRQSTTFGNFANLNFDKNKNSKINNYIKDNNSKNKPFNTIEKKDNIFNLGPKYSFKNIQNYNKYYRASFMSQSTYNDIFPDSKIITSYPDIVSFKYQQNVYDFILIGCEIIFEKLSYDKLCKSIYETMKKCIRKNRSFEMFLGCAVKDIIKKCISLGVKKNISCLFICFEPIRELYLKQDLNDIKNILVSFYLTSSNKNNCQIFDNFWTIDLINIDKANNYNEIFSKEIEKINKKKKNFSTNIINNDINKKIQENIINEKDEKKPIKRVKNKKKKCCCLII